MDMEHTPIYFNFVDKFSQLLLNQPAKNSKLILYKLLTFMYVKRENRLIVYSCIDKCLETIIIEVDKNNEKYKDAF